MTGAVAVILGAVLIANTSMEWEGVRWLGPS